MSAEGFSATPNWLYRDSDVSLYALVVYGALASHTGPGGVRPSQATLAQEARCSERQVRNALAELRDLGVVEIVRRRRGEGKSTTMTNGYVLHPHGYLADDEEAVEVPAHPAGTLRKLPAHSDEATGTQRQSIPLIEEEPLKKNPEQMFDEFWFVYPRHVAKAAAKAKFLALSKKVDPGLIVAGARRFAADPNLPSKQFVPHPSTWLNQGRWDDEPLPERFDRPGSPDVGRDEWML